MRGISQRNVEYDFVHFDASLHIFLQLANHYTIFNPACVFILSLSASVMEASMPSVANRTQSNNEISVS